MSFLDDLLDRNPTKDWRAQPNLALVLDLDEESFCGIRLGDKAARLQVFGPAEDAKNARVGIYRYWARGFALSKEQGRFVDVTCLYQLPDDRSFTGPVRRNGRSATFGNASAEADVIALVGAPDERASDEPTEDMSGGAQLTWHLNRTDLVAEFVGGKLDELWLSTKT